MACWIAGLAATAACGGDAKPAVDAGSADAAVTGPLVTTAIPPGFAEALAETAPEDNALTEAAAQLGKRLFFDPILSRDRTVACASCHDPAFGFADPRPVSRGVGDRAGSRNAPHLANLAWVRTGLFWDGRAATLEAQAGQPIENPVEMNLSLPEAVARLNADATYVSAFQRAYAVAPTEDALRKALASFVRTLVSTDSAYDRFLRGDPSALSASAARGRELFLGERTGCFHCHSERTLTNDGFFNDGSYVEGGDVGREAITKRAGDRGKFRTPSLRNVALTAPYMHDGSVATLEAVVDQYARGGRGDPSTDVQVQPLDLDESEKADLVAFLRSLTDEAFVSDARFRP